MFTLIALAVLALGQFCVGLLLLFEARRTRRTDQSIFSVLTFLVIAWTLSVGILTGVDATDAAPRELLFVIVNDIAFVASFAILVLVYLFSVYYPIKRHIGKWQKFLLGSGTLLAILSPLSFISGVFRIHGPGLTYQYGGLAVIVVAYALITLISIYFEELAAMRRDSSADLRRQTRTLLLGISLTVVHAVFFVVLMPAIFGQHVLFYAFGYIAPYYLLGFTGYGLLRQGLFDIRTIVARSLAYVLTFSIVSVLYVAPTIFLTNSLSHERLHTWTITILAILTVFIAYLFQPIRLGFNKITNRFFYRDAYDNQELLNKLNEALLSTIELNMMLTRALSLVMAEIKVEYCAVVLRGETLEQPRIIKVGSGNFDMQDIHAIHTRHSSTHLRGYSVLMASMTTDSALSSYLEKSNIDVLADLSGGHGERLGHLIMGPKQSGNSYNSQDAKIIGTVASELVIAIQNALRFEEIQNFSVTLQEKVDNATRQLKRANKHLRELDSTKDDFISMASHQLRTPLTSVKGYISLVLDGDMGTINEGQRELLDQAFRSSQQMVFLISDLLNLSRLNTGKFIIEATPINLATFVEEEVGQLKETAHARNLTLLYEKPASLPELMLDGTKIRQVVMNFIDNAIYYTPSGGTVTVALKETPTAVEYTVTDNGIGVPKAVQHKLFSKFYRAENAQKARPDGTGLGLFMAKKVIVAQNGAIIFDSQEGKGSTFGFRFSKAGHMVTDKDRQAMSLQNGSK